MPVCDLPQLSVPKQLQSSSKPKLKLPTIELLTFSGNREDWSPFLESFNSLVHNNPELEDVKFTYLKQSLKVEAGNQVKGFAGVGTDYANAIAVITKCYADKKAIRFELTNKSYWYLNLQNVTEMSYWNFTFPILPCFDNLKVMSTILKTLYEQLKLFYKGSYLKSLPNISLIAIMRISSLKHKFLMAYRIS